MKRTNKGTWKSDRKVEDDYVVKKALAAWGDSSRELEDSKGLEEASMVVIQDEANVFVENFAPMA